MNKSLSILILFASYGQLTKKQEPVIKQNTSGASKSKPDLEGFWITKC